MATATDPDTLTLTPTLINVEEDDTIEFKVVGAIGDVLSSSLRTNFTVEVIE